MMKTLILFLIQTSLFLIVLNIGLNATRKELSFLFKRPELLLRSLSSMTLFMPIVAASLAGIFNLDTPVAIALIALSVSPVPPTLPGKQIKAGGLSDYSNGLLFTDMVLSILLVPFSVLVFSTALGRTAFVPPIAIAKLVFSTMLLPLGLGMLIRRFLPKIAGKASLYLPKFSTILLLIGAVPLLIFIAPAILKVMQRGALAATILFCVSGYIVGHVFAGEADGYKKVLAFATATRHPAIAFTIAQIAYPDSKAVGVVIFLYLIVNFFISRIYLKWGKHLDIRKVRSNLQIH